MEPVKSEDEPEAGQMQRHYAMVTIHSLEKEISEGTLIVNVNLAQLDLQVEQRVNVLNLIPLIEVFEITGERKEELANRLFEKLVV